MGTINGVDLPPDLKCLLDQLKSCATDEHPSKIYKCVDLWKQIASQYDQQIFIGELVAQLTQVVNKLLPNGNDILTKSDEIDLSTGVHFLAMACVHTPVVCMGQLSRANLMTSLLSLLEQVVAPIALAPNTIALPRCLCPLLLLVDQFEKYSRVTILRSQILTNFPKRQWYNWAFERFDLATNKIIDDAYRKGELNCQYKGQLSTCTLYFGSMTCSEDNSDLPCKPEPVILSEFHGQEESRSEEGNLKVIESCIEHRYSWLLDALVVIMRHSQIDPNTLQAVVRLCLRVTRTSHKLACQFASSDGITTLLNLSTKQTFDGIMPMTLSLIRHVYEDVQVLRSAMEEIIRKASICSSPLPIDLRSLIRTINPAACRDPDLFLDCVKSLLRVEPTNVINFRLNDAKPNVHNHKTDQCDQARNLTIDLLNLIPKRFQLDSSGSTAFVFDTQTLLYIIAELTRAGGFNVELLLEHHYDQGFTEDIVSKCTALEFILDHMWIKEKNQDLSVIVSILFKFMIRCSDLNDPSGQVKFCDLFREIGASLNRTVQARVESNQRQRQMKAICYVLKEALMFISRCPPCPPYVHKQLSVNEISDQCDRLVNELASSFLCFDDDLNDGNSLPIIDSILSTFQWLMDYNTHTERHKYEKNGSFERYNQDVAENSENNYQTCPLVHPFLLDKSQALPFSSKSSESLYFRTCSPLTINKPNHIFTTLHIPDDCSSVTSDWIQPCSSFSLNNAVVIMHGLACSNSSDKQQFATSVVCCSLCRWFQECCLVDGLSMFEVTAKSQRALMAHFNLSEHAEMEKETATTSPNEPHNNPKHAECRKFVNQNSLCSLLSLVFVNRINRLAEFTLALKELCIHPSNALSVVRWLLDIVERINESTTHCSTSNSQPITQQLSSRSITFMSTSRAKLSLQLCSNKSSGHHSIAILPQAYDTVCENVINILFQLKDCWMAMFCFSFIKHKDYQINYFDSLLSVEKSERGLPSTSPTDCPDVMTRLILLLAHPVIKQNSQHCEKLITILYNLCFTPFKLIFDCQLEHALCSADANPISVIVQIIFSQCSSTTKEMAKDVLLKFCNMYVSALPIAYKIIQSRFGDIVQQVRLDLAQVYRELTTKDSTTVAHPSDLGLTSMSALVENVSSKQYFLLENILFSIRKRINLTVAEDSLYPQLDQLWHELSKCLDLLVKRNQLQVAIKLKPLIETYLRLNAPNQSNKSSLYSETMEQQLAHISQSESNQVEVINNSTNIIENESKRKFVTFITDNSVVFNQLLRGDFDEHWMNGPFGVLSEFSQILDFDIKRSFLQFELTRQRPTIGSFIHLNVEREKVFDMSFQQLNHLSESQWKNANFMVTFVDEEAQDAGGPLREWYRVLTRQIINPNYSLFTSIDQITCRMNPSSHINANHLEYFRFVGKLIAKAIYCGQLMECCFTRSMYKHILGKPVQHSDIQIEDPEYYEGLNFLLTDNGSKLTELRFTYELHEFGTDRIVDLIPDGHKVIVTEDNKHDYVRRICHFKMTESIREQLMAFLEGFYTLLPKRLISIFNELELELLISGLPTIDLDDIRRHTIYKGYDNQSPQIKWLWRALATFTQTDLAKFVQFVTGTSKVPLGGFSNHNFIIQCQATSNRLPTANTCIRQLNLPMYVSYDKLCEMMLMAVRECSEGFGFV